MLGLVREFCAENMELVPAAVAAGAARVELCDNLAVGGTTPSFGTIRAAVEYCRPRGVDVMCMVRPRGGSFEHAPAELDVMCQDLIMARSLGVTGVVFGCLRGSQLDAESCELLLRLAKEPVLEAPRGLAVTFHMAFDSLAPQAQLAAIDWLAQRGVERILTHGGPAGTPIAENYGHLRSLVGRAAGRITILPGAGITWRNAQEVADELGVREGHGTKIVRLG